MAALGDRLGISCPSFPHTYWDKFMKKNVVEKFAGQFDKDRVSDLLGLGRKKHSFIVKIRFIIPILRYYAKFENFTKAETRARGGCGAQ